MENIKRILLVEDEFIIAKDIKITLEKYAKIKVDTAKNFKQAYELFSVNDYQLLLTDINLNEEKDGIDVASQLKEIKSIPVDLLVSAHVLVARSVLEVVEAGERDDVLDLCRSPA